jgi:hypothetical protein
MAPSVTSVTSITTSPTTKPPPPSLHHHGYHGGVSGGNGQILKIWKFSLQTVGSCTCGLDARVSVQLVILQKTARSHTLQFAVRSFTDLCLEKSGLLVHMLCLTFLDLPVPLYLFLNLPVPLCLFDVLRIWAEKVDQIFMCVS